MSKFDYMNFDGGSDGMEFVVHAKKYTKQQAIELFVDENGVDEMSYLNLRRPKESDVEDRRVAYFINTPDWCGCDGEGGCYTFCGESRKGSFPVWVIKYKNLRQAARG